MKKKLLVALVGAAAMGCEFLCEAYKTVRGGRDSKLIRQDKNKIVENTTLTSSGDMTIAADPGFCCSMENGGGDSSCLPPTPQQEKQIVRGLQHEAELHLKEGNLYYVVSARWFSQWERYVGRVTDGFLADMDSPDSQDLDGVPCSSVVGRPGPIDNSDIVESGNDSEGGDAIQLATTLLEGRNYVLVPQKAWEKLFQWYTGGPALPRKMISQGIASKRQFNVEVYPLRLKLIDPRDDGEFTISISRKASLNELYEKVCRLRGIEREKACLWDYFNKQKQSRLTDSNKTMEDLNLHMDQEVLLELLVDGSFPSQTGKDSTGNELALVALEPSRSSLSIAGGPTMSNGHSSSYSLNLRPGSVLNSSFADMDDRYGVFRSAKIADKGGLAGLQNLGNTCFMNSALQCLVHTPPLVQYFLQDYSEEINKENPLGMHGELALAFGELLRKLWSSGMNAIPPRAFKARLAQFAPQFSGYNQHDSQELLSFLLDGLHEDLNRVKQKPYIEMKDWNGHPDEEVADECWRNHKARNDSVIVDVCQGQYKSTLVCPVCRKISITFDPFMHLSLPLPSTVTRSMTVTVFYCDGSLLPMPFTVNVLKHGHLRDLSQALASACCLKSDESLLLAEVYDHKIFRLLESHEQLASVKDEDHIVAYRFLGKTSGKKKLQVVHGQRSAPESKGSVWKYFGTPLITYLEESPSVADINLAVSRMLSPLKKTCPSMAHGAKRNGLVSEADGEPSNSGNGECESTDEPMDLTEIEDASSDESPFRLFLTDEKYSSCKPLTKDTVKKCGSHVTVVLEWTERDGILYDPNYLKDLPVVYLKTGYTAKKTRPEAVSLFSCLEAFLTEEPLGPDDMWYCPGCKEHREATKKLDLWTLPDILVFHLKRFSYSRYMKNKLDTFVDFPIHNLDLSKYVKRKDGQSFVYELYAISNHYGGLGGGHYTAFAKLTDENRWYNFDDSRVSPVNEADIKTSAAYVLFYQRVNRT